VAVVDTDSFFRSVILPADSEPHRSSTEGFQHCADPHPVVIVNGQAYDNLSSIHG